MDSEIRYNPQHWKVKATTNLLFLLLALAILVNSILIFGFQLFFVYTLGSPEEALASFPGCTVLDEVHDERMHTYLLKSDSAAVQVVTTEKHPFVEKYRLVKDLTLDDENDVFTKNIIGDSAMVSITVLGQSQIDDYHESNLAVKGIPLVFILYSALLIAVEIAGYCLIQRIRGN